MRPPRGARLRLPLIILAGLCVRLFIAPTPGFMEEGGDMQFNRLWMQSALEFGVVRSFGEQLDGNMLPNHGPVEIALYAAAGHALSLLAGGDAASPLGIRIALKAPGMLADLALCAVLYAAVRRLRGKKAGLIAAAAFALHPAALHNSALWGQTDAIFTLLLAVSFTALGRDRGTVAAAAMALACLTKPQALIFAPIFFLALPSHPRQLLDASNAFLAVLLVCLIPFLWGGTLGTLFQNVYLNGGQAGKLSWNAFNFWWAVLGGNAWNTDSSSLFLGIISFHRAGMLLFGATYAAVLWRLRGGLRGHGRVKTETLFAAAAVVAAAFFLFFPGVHERYLYPAVVFGLPMALSGRRGLWLYLLLSGAFTLNLVLVFSGPMDRWLLDQIPNLSSLIAVALTSLFLPQVRWTWALRRARPAAEPLPAPAVLQPAYAAEIA